MIFLLRLAALAAALIFLRWLGRWLWGILFAPAGAPRIVNQGALQRDPVCGIFVDAMVSIRTEQDGAVVYFCSERCRDAYRAAPPLEVPRTG